VQAVQQDRVTSRGIDALISARHFLTSTDEVLLGATLRTPPDIRLQRESDFATEGKQTIRLRFAEDSMLPPIDCSLPALQLLSRVNSAPTVAHALRDTQANEEHTARALGQIRAAVLRGMLRVRGN
jgi:hypothetical protein